MNCTHCDHTNKSVIYKSKYWTIVLHKQDYLARCVVDLNRHVNNFARLSNEEVIELRDLLGKYEVMLKDLFGCTMLNWCCNMNNAYGEGRDAHVHIHVRPRYKNSVTIKDITYVDKEFGAHYDRKAPVQFNQDTQDFIYKKLAENASKYLN